MGHVYFISDGALVKIGYTKNNPKKRLQQLSTGSSEKLYLLGYVYGSNELEKTLHRIFHRVNLEWFSATPALIKYINENNEMSVDIDWLDGKLMVYKKIKAVLN